jgi:hypothetical protein
MMVHISLQKKILVSLQETSYSKMVRELRLVMNPTSTPCMSIEVIMR